MIGEVAAKRTLSFVGLRLVGMDFEPGGWKMVGGPLVDWVALIVAAERCRLRLARALLIKRALAECPLFGLSGRGR